MGVGVGVHMWVRKERSGGSEGPAEGGMKDNHVAWAFKTIFAGFVRAQQGKDNKL